jgi:hypothetical protein
MWHDDYSSDTKGLYAQMNSEFAGFVKDEAEFQKQIEAYRSGGLLYHLRVGFAKANTNMFNVISSRLAELECFANEDIPNLESYMHGLRRLRSQCAFTAYNILDTTSDRRILAHARKELYCVKLPGVSLNSYEFFEALKGGGYGDYDWGQPMRVVDRLKALIEKCKLQERIPDPIEIAYEIYRTGWSDAGRLKVFNYLSDIGAISSEIYEVSLRMIESSGAAYTAFVASRVQSRMATSQEQGPAMGVPSQRQPLAPVGVPMGAGGDPVEASQLIGQ